MLLRLLDLPFFREAVFHILLIVGQRECYPTPKIKLHILLLLFFLSFILLNKGGGLKILLYNWKTSRASQGFSSNVLLLKTPEVGIGPTYPKETCSPSKRATTAQHRLVIKEKFVVLKIGVRWILLKIWRLFRFFHS